jgi:hypothetical protein
MYVVTFPKNVKNKLKALDEMAQDNEQFVDRLQEALAREYKKQLLIHIEKNNLPWKPLNPKYLEWKREQGLWRKTWKATGQLKGDIEVIKTPTGWWAGILGTKKYSDGTLVSLVAIVLEYGSPTKNIPARPLFRPTRRKMLGNIKKFVRTENSKHVKYLVNKINKA